MLQYPENTIHWPNAESMFDHRLDDAGPTLTQHWVNVVFDGYPASKKHLYNICTTSAQRLRRWSNIV